MTRYTMLLFVLLFMIAGAPVRESSYYTGPGSIHVTKWKFPVTPMCADDNDAAIAVFHTLCPSYEGKVENDD